MINTESDQAVPLKSLSADLLSLLANGQAFSDVAFAVEGRHVYAHRCILAARSPFFRMIFCGDFQLLSGSTLGSPNQQSVPLSSENLNNQGTRRVNLNTSRMHLQQDSRAQSHLVIPVGIVGYDVFVLLLQFLYSGQLPPLQAPQNSSRSNLGSNCGGAGCWHSHCSWAVDFALETLSAAHFFGVDQLSFLTQKHLASLAEKASIEDVMRILVAARKQDGLHLWSLCSKLVAKSGLPSEVLRKHLPTEVVGEIERMRQKQKVGYGSESRMDEVLEEQRTRRMQKALDSSDVELVRLMVMGEGLNLDKALALHYAATHCGPKVMKQLLDLGAANVSLAGQDGKTPLHIAAEVGEPEMIALLLSHNADPRTRTPAGLTVVDVLRNLAAEALSVEAITGVKSDQQKFELCVELVEQAVANFSMPMMPQHEDESSRPDQQQQHRHGLPTSHNHHHHHHQSVHHHHTQDMYPMLHVSNSSISRLSEGV